MNDKERNMQDNDLRVEPNEQAAGDRTGPENAATENTATPMDLDGDGMIGNTGGFYGGTSYVGSNYGADWDTGGNSRHEGNYGGGGQRDASDVDDTRRHNERDNTLDENR